MKQFFLYLASLPFALLLLTLAALTVIAGTFLESHYDSHLYASQLVYSTWWMLTLLSLFFVNILLSALRRWPFRTRHIPFLLTHLGLLMILAGTMAKQVWGTQGHMELFEGGADNRIHQPHQPTLALYGKNATGAIDPIPRDTFALKQTLRGSPYLETSAAELLSYHPHAELSWRSWFDSRGGLIYGMAPFPFTDNEQASGEMRFYHEQTRPWPLYFVTEESLSPHHTLAKGTPYIIFICDETGTELIASDGWQQHRTTFPVDSLESVAIYDSGFAGYGVHADLPFFPLASADYLNNLRAFQLATTLRPLLEEAELCEPLKEFVQAAQLAAVDPANTLTLLLEAWERKALPPPELLGIEQHLSLTLQQLAYWIEEYGLSYQQLIETLPPPTPELQQRLALSSLLYLDLLAGTPPANLPSNLPAALPPLPLPCSREELQAALSLPPLELEGPLFREITPAPIPDKREEARPYLTLRIHKQDRCVIGEALYDPTGSSLAWPVDGGNSLLRFEPSIDYLPQAVRLHHAEQICYPATTQPYSYEATISIDRSAPFSISMNQVHETDDGFRLYLANMTPLDESAVKRVQIVVNRDPMKYSLTYPGGIIVATGIILLFWIWPYSKNRKSKTKTSTNSTS